MYYYNSVYIYVLYVLLQNLLFNKKSFRINYNKF